MVATFTLTLDFSGFDLSPLDRIRVYAEPLTKVYPVAADGTTYVAAPSVVMNAQGVATLTLISLPGLQYRIKSWPIDTIIISGDWPNGTELHWDQIVSVVPSPISAVDAAELGVRLIGQVNQRIDEVVNAGTRVLLLEPGAVVPPSTPVGTIVYRKTA